MGHEHKHEHEYKGSLKYDVIKISISAVLAVAALIIEKALVLPIWAYLLIYLVPYFIVGYETLSEAFESLIHAEMFNEDFLMSTATIGALCIGFLPDSETQFFEAVTVMLLFSVGELFEEIAEGKSRKSISALMDIRPDKANIEKGGKIIEICPNDVRVGDTIVIKPGEKVPLDGIVIEGTSALNMLALTGESIPKDVTKGDNALSGCINLSGVLRVKTTKTYGESTVSRILELVENASERKSKSESFISKFAKYYTPAVVVSAIILAFLPPLLSGHFSAAISVWLKRALTFLIVSCPCALVISVPLTFFGGIGGASKIGILIKGSDYMDKLANIGTIVFDKTGTLTKGVFEVTAVHPEGCDKDRLLHLAAHVERYSTHPIAASLRQAYPDEHDNCTIENTEEITGYGIRAKVNGSVVCVGNSKLMDLYGTKWEQCDKTGTIIHVSIDGVYAGHIVISDKVKDDSESAISKIKKAGITQTIMLTGDREETAKAVALQIGIDKYYSELLPEDKVNITEKLLKKKESVAFVGDGINDAPVLAVADVGIAMGAAGSDAAIEAADIVLMDDKPSKIPLAISISKRTIAIAKQNIAFAIAVKLAVLVLSSFDITPMWLAVLADVGVTVLAICNSMRTLKS